jgi:hypothetical protein
VCVCVCVCVMHLLCVIEVDILLLFDNKMQCSPNGRVMKLRRESFAGQVACMGGLRNVDNLYIWEKMEEKIIVQNSVEEISWKA